jgi:hypothetical protein
MTRVGSCRLAPACTLAVLFLAGCERGAGPPRLEPAAQATLATWLTDHGKPPTDYVVGSFGSHDVVFLGEVHRVKHDVLFVQALFEPLYRAGIRTFATEFARREDQNRIDSLLAAPEWDERLARAIVFDQFVEWGYQEYVNLFRAAWDLNHELEPRAPRFRVLGVNDSPDWSQVRTRRDLDDDAIKAKVWRGGGERHWADVILNAVGTGEKVLVYSGIHHAFTGFRHPIVIGGKRVNFEDRRMGNYVFRALGKRAMTVFLHAPWPGVNGMDDKWGYPADGYIDALMLSLPSGPRAVGFDLVESPFDSLQVRNTLYANGYDDFRLSTFCDGWIYTKPISAYQGVTPIRDWINTENVARARLQTPNPDWREYTPAQFNAKIARGADLIGLWGRLH